MGIFDMFVSNACNIGGRNNGLEAWSWEEYRENKEKLGDKLILVDMIGRPVKGSLPISDKLFSGAYEDGTIFALYCHSGGSSGYLQSQLSTKMNQYKFINIRGGIMSYR